MKVEENIPEIIYLMGTGRSGTTILEVLLVNNPGIFGIGEASYIFKDGFLANEECSCGDSALRCSFWKRVYQKLNLPNSELLTISNLIKEIEWHSGFPKLFMNFVSPPKMSYYRDVIQRLFEAIKEVSGQNIVVDSSKYAGRDFALSRIFPGKVKTICVTRSPYGLLKAFQKKDAGEQKPKSLLATLIYDTYVLLCCRLVSFRTKNRICHIRYDDLIVDYVGTLKKIEEGLSLDLSAVKEKIKRQDFLEVGHIVTGNRLRKKGRVRFEPRREGRDLKDFSEKITVMIMNCIHFLLGF